MTPIDFCNAMLSDYYVGKKVGDKRGKVFVVKSAALEQDYDYFELVLKDESGRAEGISAHLGEMPEIIA